MNKRHIIAITSLLLCVTKVNAQADNKFFLPGLEKTPPLTQDSQEPPPIIEKPQTTPPATPTFQQKTPSPIKQEEPQSNKAITDGNFVLPIPENKTPSPPKQDEKPVMALPQPKTPPEQPATLSYPPQNEKQGHTDQTITDGGFVLPIQPRQEPVNTAPAQHPSEKTPPPSTQSTQTASEPQADDAQERLNDDDFFLRYPSNTNKGKPETKPPVPENSSDVLSYASGGNTKTNKTAAPQKQPPIPVWRDITPPSEDNSYRLLIDPASIQPSSEHPRWRLATVRVQQDPKNYRQWRLTFSCKAETARVDEVITISNFGRAKEETARIYFFSVSSKGSLKWIRHAYDTACGE